MPERIQQVESALEAAGFQELAGQEVPVRLWARGTASASGSWHVFVEGDGAAWRRQGRPSANPTPTEPVAMRLAMADTSERVLYVARPCQFFLEQPAECHHRYWTRDRYGPEVREWLAQVVRAAVDGAPMVLIGYSGGAHLALQLAADIPGVQGVVTIAGNLDDARFAQHHRLPSPAHGLGRAPEVPLWSLSGGEDRVVPPSLTEEMLSERGYACYHHQVVAGVAHQGPWRIDWPQVETFLGGCAMP